MSNYYRLKVSNSNKDDLLTKGLEEDSFKEAMLKSQKILKQNTKLNNKFTSDIEVTLTEINSSNDGNENDDIVYKMIWEKPIFSPGYKISKGWEQSTDKGPYTGNTKHTIIIMLLGSWIFILVSLLLAFFTIYSIFTGDINSVAVFNSMLFIISIFLNFISPLAKNTLNRSAKSKTAIGFYNILTSFPAWIIVAVTAVTTYSDDVISNGLKAWVVVFVGVIVIVVIIKISFDIIDDIEEYYVKKLEKETFTTVKESSISTESLVKEIEKPNSTEIRSSEWKKLHIFLHFFLLSFIVLQYFFLKNPKKNTLRNNLLKK